MARLILKSPYLKPGGTKSPGGYLKYIATREGVEMAEDTSRHLPATADQQKKIAKLLKQYRDCTDSHEYQDYLANPTRGNAYAFISGILELHGDAPQRDVYLKYIDERPGSNGLFTDEGVPIVLSQVQKEMNEHPGNIWTHIISLRREDAERLGYNNPDAWMHLLRSQRNMIAQQMKIRPENFRWYAAFHNEGHHPHVHMMAYSIKPTEPYLTEKGIATIKSNLAQEIFRQDLLQIYQKQSDLRDELRQESRDRITEIVEAVNHGSYDNPQMQMMLIQLADRLAKAKGKKQYGYLNAGTKKLVDAIVAELAGGSRIQELYSLWYEQKEDVLRTYTNKMPERIPLEQQKEFKTIRNAVVQAALKIDPPPLSEQMEAADQQTEAPATFEISAVRFAEETAESTPEESPPSRHSRPRVGFSNWWSDEYKLARLKQAGGKDSPPIPEEAYRLMLAEAEKGNGLAMHDVGKMLLTGQGCDQDEEAAQKWFQKAYDAFFQMEQSARDPGYWQYRLGKMHAMGYGVEQNYEDAAEWYEQAVQWGNPFAAYALGSMYCYGQGVEKDEEKAFRYLKMAAKHPSKPNAYAQYQLGRMRADNPEESERWYRLAYQGFLRIEQEMPDDKLYYRLGSMNLHGIGTEKNLELAREYLNKAAIMGNVDAVYGMGKLYLESDVQKAISMFELAAEQGNTYAEYQLGKLYCFGQGVPQDLEVGMEWLRTSASHGNEYAAQLLEKVEERLHQQTVSAVFGLFRGLAGMIQTSANQHIRRRNSIDRKQRQKIEEKKQAHGQRSSGQEYDYNEEQTM